ncbi:MAG: serine/threonine-protein kinase [Kofleriaceae bacterium]
MAAFDVSRYELRAVLAQGGMGEVVLALDAHLEREVAVKRIRAERPSADELARFLREARIQASLEHPAVVPVHDIAVDRTGRPLFVMKRLAGTEMKVLLDRLRDGTDPDPAGTRRRLLHAFVDVCMAVEFAHSRGVVHRDLKPANIMLGDYGEVYVLDWGISRSTGSVDGTAPLGSELATPAAPASDATRDGVVLGTPAYMAPEQLLGESVGPAADTYALGCVLFEIAAGVQLHRVDRSLADLVHPTDSSPSTRRADAPPELDAICERATARDVAARFMSARGLGGAVQAYLDGDRDLAARNELGMLHLAAGARRPAPGGWRGRSARRDACRRTRPRPRSHDHRRR